MPTSVIKVYKEISSVPAPYVANSVYYIRSGVGIDIYVSNSTGSAIHKHNDTLPRVGKVEAHFVGTDFDGWIKLDGRLKSTLTATQQANATLLGFGANMPNASNSYLSQNGTTLGSVSGSNTRTIAQNNLPNVALGGSTNTGGSHTHNLIVGNQPAGLGSGNSADLFETGVTETTEASGSHSHTITTNSINGGVTQVALDIKPSTLSVNYFVYLGT